MTLTPINGDWGLIAYGFVWDWYPWTLLFLLTCVPYDFCFIILRLLLSFLFIFHKIILPCNFFFFVTLFLYVLSYIRRPTKYFYIFIYSRKSDFVHLILKYWYNLFCELLTSVTMSFRMLTDDFMSSTTTHGIGAIFLSKGLFYIQIYFF